MLLNVKLKNVIQDCADNQVQIYVRELPNFVFLVFRSKFQQEKVDGFLVDWFPCYATFEHRTPEFDKREDLLLRWHALLKDESVKRIIVHFTLEPFFGR